MTGDDRSRRSTGTNEMNGVNDADGVDRKLSDALVAYEPPPPSAGLVDGIMEAVASEACDDFFITRLWVGSRDWTASVSMRASGFLSNV